MSEREVADKHILDRHLAALSGDERSGWEAHVSVRMLAPKRPLEAFNVRLVAHAALVGRAVGRDALRARDDLRLVLRLVLCPSGNDAVDVLGVGVAQALDGLLGGGSYAGVAAVDAAESAGVGLHVAHLALEGRASLVRSLA